MLDTSPPEGRFLLPPIDQTSSRLMRLPTELRTSILRLLLKSQEPLLPRATADSKAGYQLSSQVLRCCQSLYEEAQYILYHENVLSIVCEEGKPSESVSLLNCTIYLPGEPLSNADTVNDLLASARRAARIFPSKKGEFKQLNQIYPSLCRFDRIQVTMKINREPLFRVSSSCRCLRSFVAQKQVTVILPQTQQRSTRDFENVIKCFRWWRCKSLTFRDIQATETAGIVPTAPCSVPSMDLFQAAFALQEIIDHIARQIYGLTENHGIEDFMHVRWDKYENSIHHNDAATFRSIVDDLMALKSQATNCAVKDVQDEVEKSAGRTELLSESEVVELRSNAENEICVLEFQAKVIARKIDRIKTSVI